MHAGDHVHSSRRTLISVSCVRLFMFEHLDSPQQMVAITTYLQYKQ